MIPTDEASAAIDVLEQLLHRLVYKGVLDEPDINAIFNHSLDVTGELGPPRLHSILGRLEERLIAQCAARQEADASPDDIAG
jgi:hypothetical protein